MTEEENEPIEPLREKETAPLAPAPLQASNSRRVLAQGSTIFSVVSFLGGIIYSLTTKRWLIMILLLLFGCMTQFISLIRYGRKKAKGYEPTSQKKDESEKAKETKTPSQKTKLGRGWIALWIFAIWLIVEIGGPMLARTEWMRKKFGGAQTIVFVPVGYEKRFCESLPFYDYTNDDPPKIVIGNLTNGCYGNHVKIPQTWDIYTVQKDQHPGDYASVWCVGDKEPRPIRGPEYPSMDSVMVNCHEPNQTNEFYSEGKGTLTLIPLRKRTPTFSLFGTLLSR